MQMMAGPGGNERAGPAAELSRRIAALVARARDMGTILDQEDTPGGGTTKRIVRAQIELERAVARILEAERAWHEWNDGPGREGGQTGKGGDIDFDATRHEIGCRLARLRECCGSD